MVIFEDSSLSYESNKDTPPNFRLMDQTSCSDDSSEIDEKISPGCETSASSPPPEVDKQSRQSYSSRRLEKLLSEEMDEDEKKRIRNYKKLLNPRRISLAQNKWDGCVPIRDTLFPLTLTVR